MNKFIDLLKKYKHYIFAILIISCFVAVDQITKYVVKSNVQYGLNPGIEVINKFFYITYSENTGAMNGSFSGKQVLLIIITLIALGIFIYLGTQHLMRFLRFRLRVRQSVARLRLSLLRSRHSFATSFLRQQNYRITDKNRYQRPRTFCAGLFCFNRKLLRISY